MDFFRARVVDGLGRVIQERLFAVETDGEGEHRLRDPAFLGDLTPCGSPADAPPAAAADSAEPWLHVHVLRPMLDRACSERLAEVERVADHVELSLTELLQKADEEIGRAAGDLEAGKQGAEGRLAKAETRHAELLARRDRRRRELAQERSLSLQSVERLAAILALPHPERETPEVRNLRPDFETEAIAMRVVAEHEEAQGRRVEDIHEKNLGYDLTSLDPSTGELRLIEVKGIGGATGSVLLTPNERRVAEDRRDCYWLYVVTNCKTSPQLEEPIRDPARLDWHEVRKVADYFLSVNALKEPTEIHEEDAQYGGGA